MIEILSAIAIAAFAATMQPTPICDNIKKKLTSKQLANAKTIEIVMRGFGIKPIAIKAAIVNAYCESGLDAKAVGDSGHSGGLFQLSDFGAGQGMSNLSKLNPWVNTATIVKRELIGKSALTVIQSNSTVEGATKDFCILVERPKDKQGQAAHRAQIASSFFA